MMSYEKLDVYQCSIQFLAKAIRLIDEFPRGGHSAITDQLKRAAMSIPLNIAEGAGIKGSNSYHNCVIVKIETALMVRMVFHLPWRQTKGFLKSFTYKLGLNLDIPHHTTFSRRAKKNGKIKKIKISDPIWFFDIFYLGSLELCHGLIS
jgi:hypothetical protein